MFPTRYNKDKARVALNIAVLVVSDTRTLETDTSGALLKGMIEKDAHVCVDRLVVKDEKKAIHSQVETWIAASNVDVVITTGGTGFSGFDVTPEAVEPLFDKRMEGFSVLFHQYSAAKIGSSSIQSRATAGLASSTLVFCLPGSRGACADAWEGILSDQLNSQFLPCNFLEILPRFEEHLK